MQKQSKEETAKCEISFVVSRWSTDESLIKAHSGFISSPALNLLKPFPEIQFSQTCFSHHATFSSAAQNTAQSSSLPTAFLCHLCNVRTLAVPIPCCKSSSFPYTWSYLACWFQHMDRAGQQAIMGALKPTDSWAAGGASLSTASLSGSISGITQREVPKRLALQRHIHSSTTKMGVALPVLAFQTHNLWYRKMQKHSLWRRVTEHEVTALQSNYQIQHKHTHICAFCSLEHFFIKAPLFYSPIRLRKHEKPFCY